MLGSNSKQFDLSYLLSKHGNLETRKQLNDSLERILIHIEWFDKVDSENRNFKNVNVLNLKVRNLDLRKDFNDSLEIFLRLIKELNELERFEENRHLRLVGLDFDVGASPASIF